MSTSTQRRCSKTIGVRVTTEQYDELTAVAAELGETVPETPTSREVPNE